MTTFFSFAIADSMFPARSTVTREPLTVDEVRSEISNCVPALNSSHAATINAMRARYALEIEIPDPTKPAPRVALVSGDSVIVMSVRGLPRLDATRHEYTEAEIASATFEFARWSVQ